MVLQYVDDILLCAETEEACSRASEDFLNFLASCGYKASREKAQLCQQSVRYLGLIIWEGTRAIGPERIKPILNHPLPMTLRQLRGFFGNHRLLSHLDSRLWGTCPAFISTYSWNSAGPNWQNWFGLQILKRLLRFFTLLSCKLPLWACPQGQNLNCLSLKEKVWPWEFWHKPEGLTSNLLLI